MNEIKKLCKFRGIEVEVKVIQETPNSKPQVLDCLQKNDDECKMIHINCQFVFLGNGEYPFDK